jgi:hypothetical protein
MPNIILSPKSLCNSITVETRKGNRIENEQVLDEISIYEKQQEVEIVKKFPGITLRNDSTAIYNCNGLTFASRRTRIWITSEIRKILQDDNYHKIEELKVLPGDVILYIAKNGDIEHSGIVVSEPDRNLRIPFILSKWGNGPEIIHFATNCPYNEHFRQYLRVVDGN